MSDQRPSDLESIANQSSSSDPIGDLQDRYARDRVPRVNLVVMLIALLALGVIVAVGLMIYTNQPTASATEPAALTSDNSMMTYDNLPRGHSSSRQVYPQVPPVGGIHAPAWLNCGIYDQPVPNENAVHSFEHGAVWITYQPGLSTAAVQKLRALVTGHEFVILSPYPNLPKPVVASAWGVQLPLDNLNEARLQQFISNYEQGPQTPEPGAPCTGGVGQPISQ